MQAAVFIIGGSRGTAAPAGLRFVSLSTVFPLAPPHHLPPAPRLPTRCFDALGEVSRRGPVVPVCAEENSQFKAGSHLGRGSHFSVQPFSQHWTRPRPRCGGGGEGGGERSVAMKNCEHVVAKRVSSFLCFGLSTCFPAVISFPAR